MLYVKPDFQDELVSLFDFCLRNETLQIKISLEQHKSFGWLSFCQYYLRYDGRRLDDRLSLRYYGIKYGSVIDIVFLDAATQSPPPFKRQVPHLASFDCDVEEESPSQVKRKSALVHRLSRLFGSFTLFVMHPPQAEATNKVFSSQGTVAFEVVSEPHQKAPTVRKSPGKALTFSVCDRDLQTPDWAEHHVVMHERKSPWHHTFGTMYCIGKRTCILISLKAQQCHFLYVWSKATLTQSIPCLGFYFYLLVVSCLFCVIVVDGNVHACYDSILIIYWSNNRAIVIMQML